MSQWEWEAAGLRRAWWVPPEVMNLPVPLQDGSEVTPVFRDGDDDNFPGQQLERLYVGLVMQDV